MTFRLLEHTADLGLEARGPALCAALDQAVAAMAEILAGVGVGAAVDQRPVAIAEPDPEALVVALLDECLFLLEVHGWLALGARLQLSEGGGVTGELLGEPWDPSRHDGTAVKAITWHQLAVEQGPAGITITVYVDC